MNVNGQNDARRGASPRARRGTRLVPAALLLLAPVMGACEGDNLFNGGAEDYVPVAVVSAPEFASAGETISVRVDGFAARGVSQLSISIDGIVSQDTVIDGDGKTSVSKLLPIAVPQALQGTALRVRAHVVDEAGQFSPTAEAVVEAYGPPFVQIVSAPVTVQPGQVVDVEVAATAVENVDQIALKLSGAVSKDTTVSVSPASRNVRQTIRFQVPTLVEDTIMTVTATARDQAGNRGSTATDVPFVVAPPTVSVIAPTSVQAGGLLPLEIRAQALRKIDRLEIVVSGSFTPIKTTVPITPARANVTHIASVQLPGSITNPNVQVHVTAFDRSEAPGTAVQAVQVPLSAPMSLTWSLLPASVAGGHILDARVRATGPRPIKEIIVHWRGFTLAEMQEAGIKPDSVVFVSPAASPVEANIQTVTPCLAAGGSMIVEVTAKDEANQLSPVLSAVVAVAGNAACAPADSSDSTSAALRGIAAAPGLSAAPFAPFSNSGASAFLAGRGFTLRTAGRKRSARR